MGMDERAKLMLGGLPQNAKVVEIGPSYAPLAPRRDGWNVTIVDHTTREGLIQKYGSNTEFNAEVIEEVDLVWRSGSLDNLVGRASWGTYDAFIASHVIEHTTDIVRFLQSARNLLKNDGLVILALPDKRKCFDVFRPISTTGDALVAYQEKRQRHTAKTFFEHFVYQAQREGRPGWTITDQSKAVLTSRIESGFDFLALAESEEYIDAHNWTFTPSSFELMVLELRAMGLLQMSIEKTQEAPVTEFYAWLRPCEGLDDVATIHCSRLDLLERILVEQAEASRQVIGSPLASEAEALAQGPGGVREKISSARAQAQGQVEGSSSAERPRLRARGAVATLRGWLRR
jgi:SAM-dependent methyltransferase